jgi:uncharacterized protein YcnI
MLNVRTHPTLPRYAGRLTAIAATAGAALVLGATAASAHVHVIPDNTASGGFAQLTFRVPSEEPVAKTTKVELTLPGDRPLASVAVKPVAGWSVTVTDAPLAKPVTMDGTTLTKAPHVISWTASPAAALAPGQYQEFSIDAGPLPSPGTLTLPVAQSYSDGTVVNWDQTSQDGKPEPEHPAPAFTVTASTGGGDDAPATSPDAAAPTPARPTADPVARWLAGGASAVALIGAATAIMRRRRAVVRS